MNISGSNPNISETDLSNKAVKKNLKINKISEVKGNLSEAVEKAKTNETDEIFFKADGKNFVASGKQIDIKSFESNLTTSNQMKLNGKEISIEFVDDHKVELNSKEGKSAFNFKDIREVRVGTIENAKSNTRGKKLDEVFFSVDGKDYVAYGKKMDTDNFCNAVKSNQITFNGKEVSLKSVVDGNNTLPEILSEGFNNAIGSDVAPFIVIPLAAAGGFVGMVGGGLFGAVIGSAVGLAVGYTLVGTPGAIHEAIKQKAFKQPGYESIEYVGPSVIKN